MNVLVLAPHPDDEAIGCGGALCLHADRGDRIVVVFLTSGENGIKDSARDEVWTIREAEARAAAKIIGVQETVFLRYRDSRLADHVSGGIASLLPVLGRERSDIIYFPHPQEWHPDHKATVRMVDGALQPLGLTPQTRAYEIWTPLQEPMEVVDITPVWERKLAAVRAHASQISQWPYERAVAGLNQYRSAISGKMGYAEAFAKGL